MTRKSCIAVLFSLSLLLLACAPAAAPTATATPPAAAPTATPVKAAPTPTPTVAAPKPGATSTPTVAAPKPGATSTPTPAKPAAAKPKYGGTIRLELSAPEFGHFNVLETGNNAVHRPAAFSMEKLIGFPSSPGSACNDFSPSPELVESWEWPTNTKLVLHIRPGVKFQNVPPVNGRELDAADVKLSIETSMKLYEKAYSSFVPIIASMEIPDKLTLVVNTKLPTATLVELLTSNWLRVVPKELVNSSRIDPVKEATGTGPYIWTEWTPGVVMKWKRNPDYWRKDANGNRLPFIENVEMWVIPEAVTRNAALRTGKIDLYYWTKTREMDRMGQTNPDIVQAECGEVESDRVYMNTQSPPLNDIRVRMAMAKAFDRDAFKKIFGLGKGVRDWGALGSIDYGFVPPSQYPPEAQEMFKYDLTEAKRLMKEAGYEKGFEVPLYYGIEYGVEKTERAEFIASNLSKINIKVKVLGVRPAEYEPVKMGLVKEPYLFLFSRGKNPGVGERLFVWLTSTGNRNASRLRDTELDRMIAEQDTLLDPAKRLEVLKQIQIRYAQNVYSIPNPEAVFGTMYYPYLKDFTLKPDQNDSAQSIKWAWLDR